MGCLLIGRGATDQSCIDSEQTVPIMHACVQRILKFIGVFANLTDVKSCADRSRIFSEADYKPMHRTLSVRLLPQPVTAMVGSRMKSALLVRARFIGNERPLDIRSGFRCNFEDRIVPWAH